MADESPDIERVPNFEALRAYLNEKPKRENVLKWVDKLEAWCTEIREELTKHDKAIEHRDEELDKKDERIAELESDVHSLEWDSERLLDIERGLITFEDFMEERRRVFVP